MKKAAIIAVIVCLCFQVLGALDKKRFEFQMGLTRTNTQESEVFSSGWIKRQQEGLGPSAKFAMALTDKLTFEAEGERTSQKNSFHLWSGGKIPLGLHQIPVTLADMDARYDLFWGLEAVGEVSYLDFVRVMQVIATADKIERSDQFFAIGPGANFQKNVTSRVAVTAKIRWYPYAQRRVEQKSTLPVQPPPPTALALNPRGRFNNPAWSWGVGLLVRIRSGFSALLEYQPRHYPTNHGLGIREEFTLQSLKLRAVYTF